MEKDHLVSSATQPIGVIARLLDLSERRVQQLSRKGVIPKAERGQYDLIGSVRGYVRYPPSRRFFRFWRTP